MSAPAPETPPAKVRVMGPVPPFAVSAVQSSVSSAKNPEPVQLQRDPEGAGQTTAKIALLPASATLTDEPDAEVTENGELTVAWSFPSCDQDMESFALWADGLLTRVRVSALVVPAAANVKSKIPSKLKPDL